MNLPRRHSIPLAARTLGLLVMAAVSARAAAGSFDIPQVGDADFDTIVIEASNDAPVVVEYYADWCGYCRQLEPVLASLAEEYRGRLRFVRVNVDTDEEAASRVGLRGIPTVVVFEQGMALNRVTGPAPKRTFRKLFDSYVESD